MMCTELLANKQFTSKLFMRGASVTKTVKSFLLKNNLLSYSVLYDHGFTGQKYHPKIKIPS